MEFPDDYIYNEAVRVVGEARKQNLPLRMFGACGIRAHCADRLDLFQRFGRSLSDIDFVTYQSINPRTLESFFKQVGYNPQTHYNILHSHTRLMFDNDAGLHVDVFVGNIEFCHVIPLKGRLEADFPAIPLAETLLAKLQIVKITDKDLKDVAALLLEHEVGPSDQKAINAERIAEILANDWGFYYTATTNLNHFEKETLTSLDLTDSERELLKRRIHEIIDKVEQKEKSLSWRMRAKVGTKRKWYNEIDEVSR
ncbi:MAG: hypothetical protein ABSA92_06625 [Candidatus Bathyarchaeia archaeon]|jgi:hypothetical protein